MKKRREVVWPAEKRQSDSQPVIRVWLCEAPGVCFAVCIRFDAIITDYIMENYS